MDRTLAQSEHYEICYEYEIVYLKFIGKNRKIQIGDFYGDPEVALISSDERYCVIGGCGLIIYYLKEPFIEFSYNEIPTQWKTIFRENNNIWWISEINKGSNTEFISFNIDQNDGKSKAGTYELNVFTLEVKKLN